MSLILLHCGTGSPFISFHGCWLPQWGAKDGQLPFQSNPVLSVEGGGGYSCGRGEDSQTPPSPEILAPTPPSSLFSTLQVFQKCTVKDVEVKNLVEPTTRIEPQIRELRPGALLPLKEKKVKYTSPCSCPPNCLPLPTVWYNRWLYLNPSTTLAPSLWLERNL